MLDIHFIRENAEIVKAGVAKKHINADIDRLLAVDDRRKALRLELDEKRAEQNRASTDIMRTVGEEKTRLIEAMQHFKAGMNEVEENLKGVMEEWQALMLTVPNVPDMSVPDGDSDAQNLEVRKWDPPGGRLNLERPRSHVELMTTRGMADFDRGARVAGFRGYFLKNDGALLSYALWQFLSDHFVKKGGYVPMIVPSLVRREAFMGTGYLPQSEDDLYKTQDGDDLAGTAGGARMGYFLDEIL